MKATSLLSQHFVITLYIEIIEMAGIPFSTRKTKNLNKQVYYLVGSSNFKGIANVREYPDDIFKKVKFQNWSEGGLSMKTGKNKYFLDYYNFKTFPKKGILILAKGSNHYQNTNFHLYNTSFFISVFKLIQMGISPKRIMVIAPYVRGSNQNIYHHQKESVKNLIHHLKCIKIQTVNPFDHIDESFWGSTKTIFSKKQDMVHFSREIKILFHDMISDLIKKKSNQG